MNNWIHRLTSAHSARHIGFWWGFTEGLFFFIVPDVYIVFVTLFSFRRGLQAWAYSIAGSVASVLVMYLLVTYSGLDIFTLLSSIPGISSELISTVASSTAASGLPYSPLLALGGVPLKVYTSTAFSGGLPLLTVLVWSIFARIVRIAPSYLIVGGLRLFFKKSIAKNTQGWLVAFVAFWIILYTFYWIQMS